MVAVSGGNARIVKAALVCEVLVVFCPAWLCILIFWLPGFFINLGNEHQSAVSHIEYGILLVAALAGVTAACTLLMFVLFGTRLLSGRFALICSSAGLLLSGWAAVGFLGSKDLKLFFLIPAGPFLGGLHLLYLGRSYFTVADKNVEPTR
jgi:hypothetical protein